MKTNLETEKKRNNIKQKTKTENKKLKFKNN